MGVHTGYSTSVYTGYVYRAGVCRVRAGVCRCMGVHTGYSTVRILGSVLHAVPCTEAPVCGLGLTMQASGPADSLLPKDG